MWKEKKGTVVFKNRKNDYGYGLIDVMKAYEFIASSVACTDVDGDGYYIESHCGTVQDCNDNDPTINPGADEVKHDGIDQDCNRYDLTIGIIKALYEKKKDSLAVEATSALGKDANLLLVDYGPMKWDRRKLKWTITITHAGGNPGIVTVSGLEGSESAQTTVR